MDDWWSMRATVVILAAFAEITPLMEAAIHVAMRNGLADTAVANAISLGGGFAKNGINVVVQSGSFTWEITAEIVVRNGERLIKIFHLFPL